MNDSGQWPVFLLIIVKATLCLVIPSYPLPNLLSSKPIIFYETKNRKSGSLFFYYQSHTSLILQQFNYSQAMLTTEKLFTGHLTTENQSTSSLRTAWTPLTKSSTTYTVRYRIHRAIFRKFGTDLLLTEMRTKIRQNSDYVGFMEFRPYPFYGRSRTKPPKTVP